jgi:hypothetical protein
MCNKTKALMLLGFFLSLNAFSQDSIYTKEAITKMIASDPQYAHYYLLSRKIMDSLKIDDKIVDKHIKNAGFPNMTELENNLLWAHKLQQNKPIVLENISFLKSSNGQLSNLAFIYSLGRSNCVDSSFTNTITIQFPDIINQKKHYEFDFNNCIDEEKLKSAILAAPAPKNTKRN